MNRDSQKIKIIMHVHNIFIFIFIIYIIFIIMHEQRLAENKKNIMHVHMFPMRTATNFVILRSKG